MKQFSETGDRNHGIKYLSAWGAWALAFGCSVGWGAFVMPGTTFLPIAGPAGTAIGIGIGALAMLILAANYHYLMKLNPDGGGAYSYTKTSFGYDQGFLCAWFLFLTYIAILWANATALPLIARTLLGGLFRFGFHYEIAGFHVYFGEILLSVSALAVAAWLCMRKKLAIRVQIAMACILFFGVAFCFLAVLRQGGNLKPGFVPGETASHGIFTIFSLAPWAFVGFESISHSGHEARYAPKKNFWILAVAIVMAGLAYIFLTLLAVCRLPEGCTSWTDYIQHMEEYEGIASQPVFFAAFSALGSAGAVILGICALCGIGTGLIGNYIALSRLLVTLSEDGMAPAWIGEKDPDHAPRRAVLCILCVSVFLPFLGRTAISWIVDVTTVGATIAYAFASACAWKKARESKIRRYCFTGVLGMAVSLLFALEFLIPNLISVKTLSTESYLILAAWSILGFAYFRRILHTDRERRLGRSIIAWVVLLGLVIFTSSIWMRQSTEAAIEEDVVSVESYYMDVIRKADLDEQTGPTRVSFTYLRDSLGEIENWFGFCILIQMALIVCALLFLFDINSFIQKREKQTEVEKALAEESSRAKTSFLSNMSHEIRTPMNAIIGLDNIALREPDISPRIRDLLEKIGSSARHLLGLINDILDMSRIESGRMVLKNEEFSFREFLDQINIMINGQCVDKGLNYACHIVGDVSDYYYGDDMKLKQVLINILGNAVKFTPAHGEVTLTVEQLRTFEGMCTLSFAIKDTGIGMDEAFIPKIFESFSQEHATTTNRYGGSGLGMAITKKYVDMMNGDIQIESEKGVGSVFTVTVTLRVSQRSVKAENKAIVPDKLRVLILDDDPIACEHTQVVLRSLGIGSDSFTDAQEALRAAQNGGYGFLITDYKMPGMNGLEFVRSVREFDKGKTPVILLTGYNGDLIEKEATLSGVDAVLTKPLFSDTLIKQMHHILSEKGEAGSGPQDEAPAAVSSLAGRRVLMAEDMEQNAEILSDLLGLEDIITEHAEDGEKAVQMFSEHPAGYYDAILMDVRMPVMDGLTATKAIRKLPRDDARTVPIIAMTANVFDEDVERSLQAGMDAHLSKPIEPERLYDTLAKMIARSQGQS